MKATLISTAAGREKNMDDRVLIIIDKQDLEDLKKDFKSISESISILAEEISELNRMVEERVEDEQD